MKTYGIDTYLNFQNFLYVDFPIRSSMNNKLRGVENDPGHGIMVKRYLDGYEFPSPSIYVGPANTANSIKTSRRIFCQAKDNLSWIFLNQKVYPIILLIQ